MRILIASSNRGVNGAVVYSRRILLHLHAAGHDVALACEKDSWVGHQIPDHIPVVRTTFDRWPFTECDRMADWCREKDIELLHSHLTRASNFTALLKVRYGFKSVAHLHSNHPQLHTGFHDLLLAVSNSVAKRHSLYPWNWGSEIITLPNYIDHEEFCSMPEAAGDGLRRSLHVSSSTPVLVVIGLISHRKGQDLAVRAFAELRQQRPDAVLALIGGGELPTGLPLDGVYQMGHRNDIAQLLPHASLVLIPSREEPFSLAAIEGMACGVPVIAFEVGGLAEVIADGAGVAVPPQDYRAMAAAAVDLLSNEMKRLSQGAAGRKKVHAHYGMASHVDALTNLFAKIID